jgi:hypothetical protein
VARDMLITRGARFGKVRRGEFCLCDGKDLDGNPVQLSNRRGSAPSGSDYAIAPLDLSDSILSHSMPISNRKVSVCSEACGARVVVVGS